MYQFSTYKNNTEQNEWAQIFFGKTIYEGNHKMSVHANKVHFTLSIGDEFNGLRKDYYLNVGTGRTGVTTATLIDLSPEVAGIRCGVKTQETSSGDIMYYVYCKNDLNMINVFINVEVHSTGDFPTYIKPTPQEPFNQIPSGLVEARPQGELITRLSNKRSNQSVPVVVSEVGTYKLAKLIPTKEGTSATLTLLINRRSGAVSSDLSWIVTARCYLSEGVYTGDLKLISLEKDGQPNGDEIGYKIAEDGMEIYFKGKTPYQSIYYQVLSFDKSSTGAEINLIQNPVVSQVELDFVIGGKTLFNTTNLQLTDGLTIKEGGNVTETRHGNVATIKGNINATSIAAGTTITTVTNKPMHNVFIPCVGTKSDGSQVAGTIVLYTSGALKVTGNGLKGCSSFCFNATYNIR